MTDGLINTEEGVKKSVRWMSKNNCWAIPFNCCFVMKTIDDFIPAKGTLQVSMTLIMRIKFTGLPDIKHIMDFCACIHQNHSEIYHKKSFMCRINEEEGIIIDPPKRVGTVKETKS